MKKLLNEPNSENSIVSVILRGSDNEEYECNGVLMKESKDMVRIGFNAVNDKVVDDLDINKSDIVSSATLDSSQIESL
jgi:hypothetical protein